MPAATSDEPTKSSTEPKAAGETKTAPAKASTRATARSAKTTATRAKTAHAKDKEGSVTVTEATGPRQGDAGAEHGAQPEAGGITITIPLDQVVTVATTVARMPLNAARKVAPTRVNGLKGIPVYLGIGGLTAVGLVEWPVAAAAGAGYAVLRRWGPLKPDQDA
jgi:hypothetical protein